LSFAAFDPRQDILNQIGYNYNVYDDDIDRSCISFSYPDGPYKDDICYVPMLFPNEVRSGELPNMPFIEVTLVDAPSGTHNVQGDVKENEAYIDFNIYVTNTDEINKIDTWMPVCKNEIVNLITQNRHVSGCTWMEVIDTGREIVEQTGKTTIFHHVISIYCFEYNKG